MGKTVTHYAVVYRPYFKPETVACIVVKHPNNESAKIAANEALRQSRYGELHIFEGTQKTYGYSVHRPSSDSDSRGFVNFQTVVSFCTE